MSECEAIKFISAEKRLRIIAFSKAGLLIADVLMCPRIAVELFSRI